VRWLVANPAIEQVFGFRLVACVGAPVQIGLPSCQGELIFERSEDPTAVTELRLDFAVPAREALLPALRLAVLGTICDGARVRADAPWPFEHCEDGALPRAMSIEIDVADGLPNHNPQLSGSAILFDDEVWGDPGSIFDLPPDCASSLASPLLPRIAAKSSHRVTIHTRDEDREPLPPDSFSGPRRESLLLSHAATAGELERPWSAVGADGPNDVAVGFTAPAEVPAAGLVSRVYFVARDYRGGADFAIRAVCVTP
jgi:hypothetical protein